MRFPEHPRDEEGGPRKLRVRIARRWEGPGEEASRQELKVRKRPGQEASWGHPSPRSSGWALTLPLPWMIPEHKVIIVGLDNAGKTTILYQFLTNEVVHTCSTIGSNVEEIVFQKTHFLMWDLGGQEALRPTWDTYYSNAEFVILVIDSTDRKRLSTTREELYKMLAHEALQDASVLILANKQDVKGSMTTAEISRFLKLSAIKDHPWHIQGCCALTGEGLPAGLQWMQSQATTN
ncbi:putative ADP-ribosylation factor-like protein 5C isoform X2 [Meriones unguiculatus]|uniref:putative ADP-ribosylation factor-like protein 5C isoform X2 n=1 Tax=Meriones unguiculatus TaxID=10047 RepID=UPI0010908C41|nr:putative ADP-ribosylation factor-like protein 5C isoform X2 [Meriones unguiculatus]